MIDILLESGLIEIDCRDTNTGATAVHWACEFNNVPAAQHLLSKCPDIINETDHAGESPLHYASLKGNHQAISLLLSLYKDQNQINTKNDEGNTPLHNAALNNNNDCIALLLKAGADPKLQNKKRIISFIHLDYPRLAALNIKPIPLDLFYNLPYVEIIRTNSTTARY